MIRNFQQFNISEIKQQTRISTAEAALGKRTVERLLAFSSYLFGFSRQDVAKTFNYTVPGLASMIQRVYQHGPESFTQVQGQKQKSFQKDIKVESELKNAIETKVIENVMNIKVNLPTTLAIPFDPSNPSDQLFVLKCQQAGIFSIPQASDLLDKTSNQIQNMKRKLTRTGGVEAVLDQRQGQKKTYKFSPEAQSELLYYVVEDLVEHHSISSIRIHEKLTSSLKLEISDRMVRNHLEKLGLSRIKANLIELAKKKFHNF
jgi:transposase